MPTTAHNGWKPDRVVPSEEVLSHIRKRYTIQEAVAPRGGGPSRDLRIEGFTGTIGFISSMSGHFCDRCNRLRVTADGRIRGCLFSDDESSLLPLLHEGRSVEEVADFLKGAVARKPRSHTAGDRRFKTCQRPMSAIGG